MGTTLLEWECNVSGGWELGYWRVHSSDWWGERGGERGYLTMYTIFDWEMVWDACFLFVFLLSVCTLLGFGKC